MLFLVVLILFLIALNFSSLFNFFSSGDNHFFIPTSEEIREINLFNPKTNLNITIKRANIDNWIVVDNNKEEFDADKLLVNELVNNIKNFKLGDLVSFKEDSHKLFDLESGNSFSVKVNTKNSVYSLLVGKSSSVGSSYVRKPDSNNVYLASYNFTYLAGYNKFDFYSKQVNDFSLDQIKQVKIGDILISRSDIENISSLEQNTQKRIRSLLNFNAIRVVSKDTLNDLQINESVDIFFELNDGKTLKHRAIRSESDYFYETEQVLYQITSIIFDNILGKVE